MVYLIYNRKRNICKIGCSNNPNVRFIDLQVSNPDSLELLFTKEGSFLEESKLHEKYKDQLIRGEWFNYIPEMSIDFIGFELEIQYTLVNKDLYKVIFHIDNKHSVKYLFFILKYANSDLSIPHSKEVMQMYCNEVDNKTSLRTVQDAITQLVKFNIIEKHAYNKYSLSKLLFKVN